MTHEQEATCPTCGRYSGQSRMIPPASINDPYWRACTDPKHPDNPDGTTNPAVLAWARRHAARLA